MPAPGSLRVGGRRRRPGLRSAARSLASALRRRAAGSFLESGRPADALPSPPSSSPRRPRRGPVEAAAEAPWPVPFEEVLDAIGLRRGYDVLATTNGARLQADVLLHLARSARERRPDGPPLLVRHDDWFRALLQVTGITAERAPSYVRLAWQTIRTSLVEYRAARVIRAVLQGPFREALGVTISCPPSRRPLRILYVGTRASPRRTYEITNKRGDQRIGSSIGDVVVSIAWKASPKAHDGGARRPLPGPRRGTDRRVPHGDRAGRYPVAPVAYGRRFLRGRHPR